MMGEGVNIQTFKNVNRQHGGKSATGNAQNAFSKLLNTEISFRKGLCDKVKESFYTEMASMLNAGIDLKAALDIIIETLGRSSSKVVFQSVTNKIISGATLNSALKSSGRFTDYEYYTIRIGEESGKLADVLQELALFFQKRIKQKRLIIGALAYPSTIVVVAVSAIVFMLSYVVPMFSNIFERSGDELPGITRSVIALSHFFQSYGSALLYLILSVVAIGFWQRKKLWMRKLVARIVLNVPVWGKLTHKVYLAQISQTMAMLLGSNVPVLNAIRLTKLIIRLYPFQLIFEQVEKDIIMGTPLHAALKKHRLFPLKQVAMIKVGEETNQLDYFFKRMATQLSGDVEHQSAMLSKFIEPVIIIVLGLLVGIILVAMYLPLFKLGQNF
jgi:type IV pilus assembly protein PilC